MQHDYIQYLEQILSLVVSPVYFTQHTKKEFIISSQANSRIPATEAGKLRVRSYKKLHRCLSADMQDSVSLRMCAQFRLRSKENNTTEISRVVTVYPLVGAGTVGKGANVIILPCSNYSPAYCVYCELDLLVLS
jgi:hypothetical protein